LRLPAAALVEALGTSNADAAGQAVNVSTPSAPEVESRASRIFARLAEAEPSLASGFTSAGQREQILSVLELIRPAPGTELQRRGEPSEGIVLLESGTLLKGTPWGTASSRRSPRATTADVGVGVCGVGIVGFRRGPPATTAADDDAPVQPGATVGSLSTDPAQDSLFAHVGVVAYRLPRRAALVILASTHEFSKGKLIPRATPYHLRRPPPPPPPFALLTAAALLGEGGTSRVLLVRKGKIASDAQASPSRREEEYALKILRAAHISAPQAVRERIALATCNHQFLPRLEGACDGFLLMEAVRGCELFYLLREVHRFEPATATFYAAMALSAVIHLHSHSMVHRDIKPENLVLDEEGYLRLVDLGLCRPLDHRAERAWTLCGTPEYTAPEVLRGAGHGKEADVWAIGVLIFELLAGYPAFCGPPDEPTEIFRLVLNASPSMPKSFPRSAKELIALLLRAQPHTRLGSFRGGAVDVAVHPFFRDIDFVALLSRGLEAPLIPVIGTSVNDDSGEISKLQADLSRAVTGSRQRSLSD